MLQFHVILVIFMTVVFLVKSQNLLTVKFYENHFCDDPPIFTECWSMPTHDCTPVTNSHSTFYLERNLSITKSTITFTYFSNSSSCNQHHQLINSTSNEVIFAACSRASFRGKYEFIKIYDGCVNNLFVDTFIDQNGLQQFVIYLSIFGGYSFFCWPTLVFVIVMYHLQKRHRKKAGESKGEVVKHEVDELDLSGLHDKKINVFSIIWGTIKSIIIIGVFEFQTQFSLFFSLVTIMEREIETTDIYMNEKTIINGSTRLFLVFIIMNYIVVDVMIILTKVFREICFPFRVSLILCTHQEHILYRHLSWSMNLFFIIIASYNFFSFRIDEWVYKEYSNFNDYLSTIYAIIEYILAIMLLLKTIYDSLQYDSLSSIELVRQFKKLKGKEKFKFPDVKLSFAKCFGNIESILSEFLFTLSIAMGKKDVDRLKDTADFRHLNWSYLEQFEDDQIFVLKKYFLKEGKEVFEKESFHDYIFYSAISVEWLKNLLCFIKMKKDVTLEKKIETNDSELKSIGEKEPKEKLEEDESDPKLLQTEVVDEIGQDESKNDYESIDHDSEQPILNEKEEKEETE